MPNKKDSAPYSWPTGQEEGQFASRTDTFPNGTSLPVYSPRVLAAHVKSCLDEISDGQTKDEKK